MTHAYATDEFNAELAAILGGALYGPADFEIGYDYPVYDQYFFLPPNTDDVDVGPWAGYNTIVGSYNPVDRVEDWGYKNSHLYPGGTGQVELGGSYTQFSTPVVWGDFSSSAWMANVDLGFVSGDVEASENGSYRIDYVSGDIKIADQVTIVLPSGFDHEVYATGVLGEPGVTVIAEGGNNYLVGGDGDDTLIGGDGWDDIIGGPGNDVISGGANSDYLIGGAGNDDIKGGTGHDYMRGDEGNDTLIGGDGHDYINGGEGNDVISGGSGNDDIQGGDGDDTIGDGDGDDYVDGGDGDDIIVVGSGNNDVWGGRGADTFIFQNDGRVGTTTVYDFNPAEGDEAYGSIGGETFDYGALALADGGSITWNGQGFEIGTDIFAA